MKKLKKIFILLLIIALSLSSVLLLSACNEEDTPDDDGEPSFPEDDIPLEGLVLIRKNVAQFKVVIASGAGSDGRRAANNLVSTLKELGVEIADAVEDKNADAVTDCEIIVGTGAKNRPDACNVSASYLGEEGYTIKVVGSRVIIAGGTAQLTKSALENFIKTYLGITDETTSLRNVAVAETLKVEVLTDYAIDKLTVGTTDISKMVIACDKRDFSVYPGLTVKLQETLEKYTGVRLDIVDTKDLVSGQKTVTMRKLPYSVDKDGKRTYDDGFYAYVKEDSLYIECEYDNAFESSFDKFISTYITSKKGNVTVPADLNYKEHVSTVTYCTYGGAVGDGVTDDFLAILNTHEYANLGGQKVIADPGKVFYIGYTGGKEIIVKTDCDFGTQTHAAGELDAFGTKNDDPKLYMDTANFIIDDTLPEVYPESHLAIFKFARDGSASTLKQTQYFEMGFVEKTVTDGEGEDAVERIIYERANGDPVLAKGATSFPELAEYITKPMMVALYNSTHRDFIRYGSNENSGAVRRDIIIVDENGNIDPTTPVIFEFKAVSTVTLIPIDDTPITVNGGHFKNKANQTLDEIVHTRNGEQITFTNHENVYHEYRRGFKIQRSNVTFTNVRHKITGEKDAGYGQSGESGKKYSTNNGGYPYYGFLFFDLSNNVDVIDCDLTGHLVYYEDKTSMTGDNNVPMGTYDLVVEYSNDITFTNLEMRGTDIADSSYWGIMSSNGVKNLAFTGCKISRIDAHRGFWNMTVDSTVIGHTFNVVGGGELVVTNTQRRTGANFLQLRGDYGATFEGNMTFKNCLLDAIKAFRSQQGQSRNDDNKEDYGYLISSGFYSNTSKYLSWNFGYTCYLPENITIENFVSRATEKTYVFNNIHNNAFSSSNANQYQITKKINYVTNSQNPPSFLKNTDSYTTSKTDLPIAEYTTGNYSKIGSISTTQTTR